MTPSVDDARNRQRYLGEAGIDSLRSSRITVFTGAFGSGKTELAANFAVAIANEGRPVTLVDIDILKPMFRSRELAEGFRARGIRVVSTMASFEMADLPAVSPEIFGAFDDPLVQVVVDMGGDDDGARAIGRFHIHLERSGYDMLYVVNTLRPFSSTLDEMISMLRAVERASRLSCSGIVSNTNLGAESTLDEVRAGLDAAEELSLRVDVPVRFFAVSRGVEQANPGLVSAITRDRGAPAFVVDRFMLPPWEGISQE
ncbi:MAG: hypothetical protein VB144_09465 [Clostridia bacterium]|nr:hypothetical protein [Clostridia bacterium]